MNYRTFIKNGRAMERYSSSLPPVHSAADGLEIYFLTGKKYLNQTLFCIQSLVKVTGKKFKFILVDDGSFDQKLIDQINKQLPGSVIAGTLTIEKNLEDKLPLNLYPHLHHKRKVYPHIKKLTDVHTLGGNNWKLVLDSDMLFWGEPTAIIDWLGNAKSPLYMLDCQNSYGYSKELMGTLSGTEIPYKLNVGVIGLNSTAINWLKLETWIEKLEEKEGTSYYLEQALSAMLIGDTEALVLPADEYIVNPDMDKIDDQKGILHHYVDLSKEGYYKKAWRMV
jgi:hypothetical protein